MNCQNNTPIVGKLQTLQLNRGTTLKLKAQRKDYHGNPILDEAEEIYFCVKNKWTDETPIILKDLDDMTFTEDGYYHFVITPDDTEKLPYGKYVWDFTAIEDNDDYRVKPARGYLIVGNSSCWIENETEE